MRTSHLASFLLLSSSLALVACGGAVASPSDGQSSGASGTSGSTAPSDPSGSGSGSSAGSTGTGSSGRPHSNPPQVICTPGAYVFCRCADSSESTKQCDPSGTSFSECACNPDAFPPPDCAYPPNTNPPGCPAVYSHAYQGQPCDTLNLECSYPGAGDFGSNGCASTALLACRPAPGGATYWTAAQ